MSSSLASSSRSVARLTIPNSAIQIRTVIHHARPPRMPILTSPHTPKTPSPTAGTSTPQPQRSSESSHPLPPNSSSRLEDSGLTFHHAPPPSAPSYTAGAVRPFLQWVGGQSVHLTGEEVAPKRKERRNVEGAAPRWDGGVKRRMIEMRQRGSSRGEIAKMLAIPPGQEQWISRVAPTSAEEQAELQKSLEDQKGMWGFNKRLARAKREKRREMW